MQDRNNDIEKYLKGELNAQEMHQLEKQALTDPFLAEALEGAGTMAPEGFSDDVDMLNLKIRGKAKKPGFVWPLRIAASLALIAMISLVIYNWEYPPKENLALSKEIAEPMTEKQAEEKQTTEGITHEQAIADTGKADNDLEVASNNPRTGVLAEKPTSAKDQAAGAADESKAEVMEILVTPRPRAGSATQTDDLAAAEDKRTRRPVEEIILLDVAPAETEERASEMAKGKKGAAQRSAAPGINSPSHPGQAQPQGGLESLQGYLQQHVLYPKEALDNKTEGWVSILFTVKETGELTDFMVTQALGNGCEEALIAAVKSISWIPAQDETGESVADSVVVKYQFSLPR